MSPIPEGPPSDAIKPAHQPFPESIARIQKVIASLENAKRLLRVQADLTTEMDESSLLPENYIKTTHIFDGKTAERDIAIFQLCDITDSLMRSLIDSPDSVQDTCTVNGHYKRSVVQKMRKIMRKKFKALLEGTVIDDKEFEDLLHENCSENDDGVEEEEEEGDPSANRVEELMRDLQGVKDQVEGELMQDEEGNLYELDELNEYDDIFGDNDSEFTEEEAD
ncbi:1741_t:CDS:2 [Racocetra fulgida]|uniref:1741_t:CDS:1 n=1 Tax=Racocetra fulgida TaxID=60492 RepID=A0A9N8W2L5_9GLOM|nr:1741_t:CDS:2 [Racocetra fulgida]